MLHSLNTVRALKDPLKQYMVDFDITKSTAFKTAQTVGKLIAKAGGVKESAIKNMMDLKDFKLRAQSFSYPGIKIKQSELCINGFTRRIGTIQDKSGVWKCKVTEDMNGGAIQLLQSWCDCIHNTELGLRLPSITYATTCKVTIYNSKGEQTRKIYLRGFYPIEYSVSEMNPSSSEPVSLDVSFNYDFFSYTEHAI